MESHSFNWGDCSFLRSDLITFASPHWSEMIFAQIIVSFRTDYPGGWRELCWWDGEQLELLRPCEMLVGFLPTKPWAAGKLLEPDTSMHWSHPRHLK